QLVVQARAVLDGDHAFLADLVHRLGDQVADVGVGVGGDGADLGDLLGGRRRTRDGLQLGDRGGDRLVDAALEVHRVHAGGDRLHALADEGLGQHGRGGGAVTGVVGGLGSGFLDHLRAHVLELVLQFDLLRHGRAGLGDGRGAEARVEHGVAALRAQGCLDGICEDVHAAHHLGARVLTETDFLGSHLVQLRKKLVDWMSGIAGRQARVAKMSSSRTTRYSTPSSLTSVPEYLPNRTLSPTFTFGARRLPLSSALPSPTATTSPLIGFSVAESGITMPPADIFSSSMRLMTTRSYSGLMLLMFNPRK